MSGEKTDDNRIRLAEVLRRTGLSKSEVYRQIQAGKFPPSVRQSHKVAYWRESQLKAYLRDEYSPAGQRS